MNGRKNWIYHCFLRLFDQLPKKLLKRQQKHTPFTPVAQNALGENVFLKMRGLLTIQISFLLLSRCVQPNLCDDNSGKGNINSFGVSIIQSSGSGKEDILNTLITSAQNAKCPSNVNTRCCSMKFISVFKG